MPSLEASDSTTKRPLKLGNARTGVEVTACLCLEDLCHTLLKFSFHNNLSLPELTIAWSCYLTQLRYRPTFFVFQYEGFAGVSHPIFPLVFQLASILPSIFSISFWSWVTFFCNLVVALSDMVTITSSDTKWWRLNHKKNFAAIIATQRRLEKTKKRVGVTNILLQVQ